MRPRSKLLSKGGLLLPTITEGTEETLRELNDANTQHAVDHLSSDDYLLSICHLAHPTFPTSDVSASNERTHRLSRLRGTSEFNSREMGNVRGTQQREHNEVLGSSDPLEYLYGHHNNLPICLSRSRAESFQRQHVRPARSRVHSIPHAANPGLPRQRKSSCPELHTDTNLCTVPNISPKHSRPKLEAGSGSVLDDKAEEGGPNPIKRQSLVSQWISDCRSAWREGRMRACMLPAITDI
ncbi:uncharacterized protein si:dkeyp-72g9.4 [Dunckerocampus dactyliophorus]|uniref:uncharacterized protein si:dkeyp-72g9.4 n=1 Tax=Dunckerocampus dactyliophorus TaxID=161453 RepID=UPI002406B88D|nr:uncharacterized protein si:dkeyp-72g9.4 [Dunckerocampus dactyliophorus]XP_054647456.1 uncharacterized protein si:dkeyp-72g9.4 [Dunckerocampus dactyliophorus]